MSRPQRRSWADEEDSETDSAASATPRRFFAPPAPRRLPFYVILSASARGLLLGEGARESLPMLQSLLQRDVRALAHLVFFISFNEQEDARHLQAFFAAVQSGNFSSAGLRRWFFLLRLECHGYILACPCYVFAAHFWPS